MVEIIGFQKRTNTDGEDFNVLLIQGSIELIKSSETGNYYPSGNLKPSDADISITKKIKEGAKHLDIIVLDHIILAGEERYYSFAEEGDL